MASAILFCLLAAATPHAQGTFPGRPGLIVFNLKEFHAEGFTGGLFAIRPGEAPRQLTGNPEDHNPSFSPDGNRLVFRRTGTSEPGIHILDIQTGATTRVTTREDDLDPAFGPNGTIAFSRFASGNEYDLFIRTSSGRIRRITSSLARDEQPIFTPNGKRIIFHRRPGGVFSLGGPRKELQDEGLYSIRVDGSGLKALGSVGEGGLSFDVSPDGRRLLFFRVRGAATPEQVRTEAWSQALDGGKPRRLSNNSSYPTYSPAGNKIIYSNYEGLWMRSASGRGSPTLLLGTNYLPYQEGGSFLAQPAWQPLPTS